MNRRCGSLTDWMKEEIQQQNNYCKINKWHDQGIKGKGVAVWVTEGFSEHGCQTHDRVLDAAPYASVINAYISGTWDNDKIKNLKVVKVDFDTNEEIEYNIEDFIKIHKIKIVSNSIGSGLAKKGVEYGRLWEYLKEKYNLIIFSAAGNEDKNREYENEISIIVQAAKLDNEIGRAVRESYSNKVTEEEGKVFIDFRGWNVGTSFAAPYLAGKTALVSEKYPEITQEQLLKFMVNNCEDLSNTGFDKISGHGLFIMPDPDKSFFEDVHKEAKGNEWSKEARLWAEENEIIKGDEKGDMHYKRAITREEIVTILYRFKEYIKNEIN